MQEKEQLGDTITLANTTHRLRIKKFIRIGRGEKGLWCNGKDTILADTLEALGRSFLKAVRISGW
ncbi:MAG: hypothetical protein LUO98_07510 [Methanoregula sp.]|nr:hypothetical protein [Methanoregula sp.]